MAEIELDPTKLDSGAIDNIQPKLSCAICKKSEGQLKSCSLCHSIFYCSVECQKKDWKEHKPKCKSADATILEQANAKTLSSDDFEVIKKLGDGNFTKVFQVTHLQFPHKFYALKICEVQKVQSMRRETDILMEKHALGKIRDTYYKTVKDEQNMPSVRLITTFKDHINLYFLTEMFRSKNEVWEHCRSFGMIQDNRARYTFFKIC